VEGGAGRGEGLQRDRLWLPDETVDAFREYLVGIKGPLTTPVGGGIRSLNVALRQTLDLYACVRPVRWFQGVPSPVKEPELVDMVIFRENTEDVYAGKELEEGTEGEAKLLAFLEAEFGWEIRPDSGLGIKPVSESGTKRLMRAAINYALAEQPQVGDPRPQGQHHEVHRGRLPHWGYELVKRRVLRRGRVWEDCGGDPGRQAAGEGRDRRRHAPAGADPAGRVRRHRHHEPERRLPQRRAGRPGGRHRHRPGGNINYETGHAVFEATHGTAPKYAGQDKVNPGSVILSGEMMFRYLGWREAADLIIRSLEKTIADKIVTYDFARLTEGATEVRTSQFADAMIERM
jgi:isocitrate dehydrogenase